MDHNLWPEEKRLELSPRICIKSTDCRHDSKTLMHFIYEQQCGNQYLALLVVMRSSAASATARACLDVSIAKAGEIDRVALPREPAGGVRRASWCKSGRPSSASWNARGS